MESHEITQRPEDSPEVEAGPGTIEGIYISPPAAPVAAKAVTLLEHWRRWRRTVLRVGVAAALLITLWLVPSTVRIRLWYGLLAQRLLLGLLLSFTLLAISLLWSHGQRLDAGLFMYLNQHRLRTRLLDMGMFALTQIGSGLAAFAFSVVAYLRGHPALALELLLGTMTLTLTVELLKTLAGRSRPYLTLLETRIVGWRERGRSFPSGHTAQTFFLMSLLAGYFQVGAIASLLLYSVAAIVGFTRVYIGVHYPRDVLAGAVLGSAWSILVLLLHPYLARSLF